MSYIFLGNVQLFSAFTVLENIHTKLKKINLFNMNII